MSDILIPPPQEPSLLIHELQAKLITWAETLTTDIIVETGPDDMGPPEHDWHLHNAVDDMFRNLLSILEVTRGPEQAEALRRRVDRLFDESATYDTLPAKFSEEGNIKTEKIVDEYKSKFGDTAILYEKCQGPGRVFRLRWGRPGGRKRTTVEDYAEEIDRLLWEETRDKNKARCEMQKVARDLAEHLSVVEAYSGYAITSKIATPQQNDQPCGFVVDPEKREILYLGRVLPRCQPKVFTLLTVVIEKNRKIVPHVDLLQKIDELPMSKSVVDSKAAGALRRLVSDANKVLKSAPFYVKGERGFGYRLAERLSNDKQTLSEPLQQNLVA